MSLSTYIYVCHCAWVHFASTEKYLLFRTYEICIQVCILSANELPVTGNPIPPDDWQCRQYVVVPARREEGRKGGRKEGRSAGLLGKYICSGRAANCNGSQMARAVHELTGPFLKRIDWPGPAATNSNASHKLIHIYADELIHTYAELQ